MKVVAVVPMKLNNSRLPNKNTKSFTNGRPLCSYILETLLFLKKNGEIDGVYVYCSNPEINRYLPDGITFMQRSETLDQDTTSMSEVLKAFAQEVDSDIYVMSHTTAPFIKAESIIEGLGKVKKGEYDSAFAVKRLQDFLWSDGSPINYNLENIPRTQDLPLLHQETSGFYIYTRDVISKKGRRIGDRSYQVEVSEIESVDIDEADDFIIADAIYNYMAYKNEEKNEIERIRKENNYGYHKTKSKIFVLDCTLRDGGYCNDWNFGYENSKKIINGLVVSGVGIIECGFITNRNSYGIDSTRFSDVRDIDRIIPDNKRGSLFVAMINYGEYGIESLPNSDATRLDGIRIAFHKKDIKQAIEVAREIRNKGYLLFMQPMVSLNYTDKEFLELIEECNAIDCQAFYIVDSFGLMGKKDLMRMFSLVDHNLNDNIAIGFHSHNNMQLSYSNAQALVDNATDHNLIIDCCIYGMGRGAGNLNTELFIKYLNDTIGGEYKVKPLLNIIDEILDDFYKTDGWGYSLPNYLSAYYNTHPNYASYLSEKNALTIKEIDEILSIMDDAKRVNFDRGYIEKLYFKYLSTGGTFETNRGQLIEVVGGKDVLLIAPGPSSWDYRDDIEKFCAKSNIVAISVNFCHKKARYAFISNLRRFREIKNEDKERCIVTSNIPADGVFLQTDYAELLNDHDVVQDNAGLMSIEFLRRCKVRSVYLVGFDGYSYKQDDNYGDSTMALITRRAILDAMNEGMSEMLEKLSANMKLKFLTPPKYLRVKLK